jgi:SM-20-related protein
MSHASANEDGLSAPIVVLDEFLVANECSALLQYAFERQDDFASTQIVDAGGGSYVDTHTRRSQVLYDLGPVHRMFSDRMMFFLPGVLDRLGLPPFGVSRIEAQLTSTNNGEFFRMHTDNGSREVHSRSLTFVYFFHREPRAFEGGELRFLDAGGRSAHLVFPLQNQIVFFPSGCLHEILPVGCPSGDFRDGRFTVNGWLHT